MDGKQLPDRGSDGSQLPALALPAQLVFQLLQTSAYLRRKWRE